MKKEDVIISGVHLDLTEALKSIVKEKCEKLIKHSNNIMGIRVELESDKHKGKPEFIAKGHIESKGPHMVAAAATRDLYKSIDEVVHKLDRKLRRRSRLLKVKRKNIKDIEIPASIPKASLA